MQGRWRGRREDLGESAGNRVRTSTGNLGTPSVDNRQPRAGRKLADAMTSVSLKARPRQALKVDSKPCHPLPPTPCATADAAPIPMPQHPQATRGTNPHARLASAASVLTTDSTRSKSGLPK